MELVTVGWRTEMALLEASGSVVEHHRTHVVVRAPRTATSPAPGDNFILLRKPPRGFEVSVARARFGEAFGAGVVEAYGVDDPESLSERLGGLTALGLRLEAPLVLTATSLPTSVRRPDIVVRPLETEADRVARANLTESGSTPRSSGLTALRETAEVSRHLDTESLWLGAFAGTRLAGVMGLRRAGPHSVRLQQPQVHAVDRAAGVTELLVQGAADLADDRWRVSQLVVVADPDHPVLSMFRELGFTATERLLRATAR